MVQHLGKYKLTHIKNCKKCQIRINRTLVSNDKISKIIRETKDII
jgi:hypothetical protein